MFKQCDSNLFIADRLLIHAQRQGYKYFDPFGGKKASFITEAHTSLMKHLNGLRYCIILVLIKYIHLFGSTDSVLKDVTQECNFILI